MVGIIAITLAYLAFLWLVFVKFKWMRFTPVWGLISVFFILHLFIVPLVGTRMQAPFTTDVRVVRHTIQLVPRLPAPTTVTEVHVKENSPVKKGDLLFVFDQTIYKAQVASAEAELVAAKQNAQILQADIENAKERVKRAQAELDFDRVQQERFTSLAAQNAASRESADEWTKRVEASQASVAEAQGSQRRAELAYDSQVNGVNTAIIQAEAALTEARYYLEQTEMRAPGDGRIYNLQVQEGMVAGTLRAGAIASIVLDDDPYLLAAYRQENLRFVQPGQHVVIALNTHPGEHFSGKVQEIWHASGNGQFLPSANIPVFHDLPFSPDPRLPVKIVLDDPAVPLGIGVGGATLILTDDSMFSWIGQISLRTYTWSRMVYPLPI